MPSNLPPLGELWLRIRSKPNTTFKERIRDVAQEMAIALLIIIGLAAVHYLAGTFRVNNLVLVAHITVDDFLNLAHAAILSRLVLLSLGLRVL